MTATKILDHGSVELIMSMGDDLTPVRAARTSYGGEMRGDNADFKLLAYLAENQHLGPFEFIETIWEVKAPIFVARQWFRHRTASYNEFSMRYADPANIAEGESIEFYMPDIWRLQDNVNKQSSEGAQETYTAQVMSSTYRRHTEYAITMYREAVLAGTAKEQARIILPVSVYTKFWFKINMRNLLHFLMLRTDSHAQWEFRQYANEIATVVRANWPHIYNLYAEGHFV